MEPQTIIARRIARELKSGMLVNLGIGISTLVANHVPDGIHVFFQSENGLIRMGVPPEQGMAHPTLADAGGRPVTALPGASTFDSAVSFGLIRGGHLDLTVLGGLQVDQTGRLGDPEEDGAWHGAMDLVSGARRVIVAMQRTAKGAPKIEEMHAARDLAASDGFGRHGIGGDRLFGSTAQVLAATEAELVVPDRVPEMVL
jgi:acetate CoA/acetoacetate CoA-transferase beta subunit